MYIYQKKIAHQKNNLNQKQWLTDAWTHLLVLPTKYQNEHLKSREGNQQTKMLSMQQNVWNTN